ncbi:MAG: competence/damage-inducible protein A [Elusimicrobia bacterium]|nr:MAG: competence/damage-inducible protein A [Elusimicrobiota bacterium]
MSLEPVPGARAEILCVGTELLSGKINTHVAYLSQKLRGIGIQPEREMSLIDTESEIRDAVSSASARADLILISGGLGPTFDDITREGVSASLGRQLIFKPYLWKKIERRYKNFRMRIPVNNKRQAWIVDGAEVLDNPNGSAPGQWIELKDGTVIVLMPGPFRELEPMFRKLILPKLSRLFSKGRKTYERVLRFYGIPESEADRRLSPLLAKQGKGIEATILADLSRVSLHLASTARNASAARRRLATLERAVRKEFGNRLYGVDDETLEMALGKRLKKKRWTLAVAESCTGGLLGQRLTHAPGSSSFFRGGVIAYANEVKEGLLGVPKKILKRDGAVSESSARAMAAGVRTATGAEVGIAITGVAGPDGGTRKKPVGLVHIAIATPKRTKAMKFVIPGSRDQIRSRAASAAIALAFHLLP